MNEEIIAIKSSLVVLAGFVSRQSPAGQLAEVLSQVADETAKTPGTETTVALLQAMAEASLS